MESILIGRWVGGNHYKDEQSCHIFKNDGTYEYRSTEGVTNVKANYKVEGDVIQYVNDRGGFRDRFLVEGNKLTLTPMPDGKPATFTKV
jgi:hypothetical protein